MALSLTRSANMENLSSLQPPRPRGRQVKREGEDIGLPTSASKRSKRNPLSGIQRILPSRQTIRLRKSLVQSAAEKARQGAGQIGPMGGKEDPRGDQENLPPNSRIPTVPREKKPMFSNPFTKKRQPPVPLEGARGQPPVPQVRDENKKPVPQRKATQATSATSLPVAQLTKRAALSQSQTLRGALARSAAPNTSRGVPSGHLAAPQMKRKPLGELPKPGTISDSSSSSVPEEACPTGVSSGLVSAVSSRLVPSVAMNKSLNSSFLQTFSNLKTVDQLTNQRSGKENPPCGPYLHTSNRAPLVTTHVTNPATCPLLQIPSSQELCSPLRCEVSPRPLPCPLSDLDPLSTEYLLCPEYGRQTFLYLRGCESRFMPSPAYLSRQQDVSEGMRAILVDWLVEVSTEYKMHTQTLFLAVNYIDRFLSCMSVNRSRLQLVGTCCMYVASKFEEIFPPELTEFVYITDDTYSRKQVIRMEEVLLKALEFNLLAPTAHLFAERFIRAVPGAPKKLEFLLAYLCELALLSDKIALRFRPSLVAAAAVSISAETLALCRWSSALERHTGYKWSEIQTCRKLLYRQFVSAPKLPQQAIQDKYRSADLLSVSSLVPSVSL